MQDFLCSSNESASMFGMYSAPPKRKMMLRDWVGVTKNLSIRGQFIELVDKFIYSGYCITPVSSIIEELPLRIQRVRLGFANLDYLWQRSDIELLTKGRVYSPLVLLVLVYGWNTWRLKAEDIRRLLIFDHPCFGVGGKVGLSIERLDKEFWDLETCPSLSVRTFIDFGCWDMYQACPTTVYLGESY